MAGPWGKRDVVSVAWGICRSLVPPSYMVPRGWSAKGAAEGILDGLQIPDPVSSEETPQ